MSVKPIRDGFRTVTPYLIVDGAAGAIEFYKQAFGAAERYRMEGPGGKLMHAEIKIGDSIVMLADEFPDMGIRGPKSLGGSPASILLYVDDVDAQFEQAAAAGATTKRPVVDQFYGDRAGTLEDPFGHSWTIATHKEELSQEEIERRFAEQMQQHAGGEC